MDTKVLAKIEPQIVPKVVSNVEPKRAYGHRKWSENGIFSGCKVASKVMSETKSGTKKEPKMVSKGIRSCKKVAPLVLLKLASKMKHKGVLKLWILVLLKFESKWC